MFETLLHRVAVFSMIFMLVSYVVLGPVLANSPVQEPPDFNVMAVTLTNLPPTTAYIGEPFELHPKIFVSTRDGTGEFYFVRELTRSSIFQAFHRRV